MDMITKLLALTLTMLLLFAFIFVAFGQITVRKLRRNPATRDHLGTEFMSGWDILNVAGAIARPKWVNERFKKSALYFIVADKDLILENTNCLDRCLARCCWLVFLLSGLSIISASLLFLLSPIG